MIEKPDESTTTSGVAASRSCLGFAFAWEPGSLASLITRCIVENGLDHVICIERPFAAYCSPPYVMSEYHTFPYINALNKELSS